MSLEDKHHGECVFCGYLGTVERHHVFPRAMRLNTTKGYLNLTYKEPFKLRKGRIKCKAENLMVDLCPPCHILLHLTFKMFRFKFSDKGERE